MKIYVGNFPYSVSDTDLQELFEGFGAVTSARVVIDKITGRSKGFGFVEMSDSDAQKAIADLHGTQFEGRTLVVNQARPREERPARPQYRGNRY